MCSLNGRVKRNRSEINLTFSPESKWRVQSGKTLLLIIIFDKNHFWTYIEMNFKGLSTISYFIQRDMADITKIRFASIQIQCFSHICAAHDSINLNYSLLYPTFCNVFQWFCGRARQVFSVISSAIFSSYTGWKMDAICIIRVIASNQGR